MREEILISYMSESNPCTKYFSPTGDFSYRDFYKLLLDFQYFLQENYFFNEHYYFPIGYCYLTCQLRPTLNKSVYILSKQWFFHNEFIRNCILGGC